MEDVRRDVRPYLLHDVIVRFAGPECLLFGGQMNAADPTERLGAENVEYGIDEAREPRNHLDSVTRESLDRQELVASEKLGTGRQ